MNSNFINNNFNSVKNDVPVKDYQSYNIVINSNNYVLSSGDNNSQTYYFDWSVLPDVPYKVHMTYISEINDLSSYAEIPMVYANFSSNPSVFEAGQYGQGTTSQFLGFLRPERAVATSFLYCEDTTNPPIYISGRPTNNQFTVEIYNNNVPKTLYVPSTGALADYIINLKFIPAYQNE